LNSPAIQASKQVVITPKKPIKPKKLNTSPVFLIRASYITFSSAYKNAPLSAIKSPQSGETEVYFSSLRCMKSLINPIEMPIMHMKIPT
jgi:hypothetical protein